MASAFLLVGLAIQLYLTPDRPSNSQSRPPSSSQIISIKHNHRPPISSLHILFDPSVYQNKHLFNDYDETHCRQSYLFNPPSSSSPSPRLDLVEPRPYPRIYSPRLALLVLPPVSGQIRSLNFKLRYQLSESFTSC